LILIDTSAMIEFLNKTGTQADRSVEQLITSNADVALAQITLTEILQGIKDDKEHQEVKASLLAFPCLFLKGMESYLAAAELYRSCRKRGFTIRSTVDLLIAQTAMEYNAQLLHNDRDFDAIATVCDLQIYPLLP
jgi:predicted nucleic acid-binding protein